MIPEEELKKRYGDTQFRPSIRRTEAYESDAPLFFNAKVPVHTSCRKCEAWLEAYAKIVGGLFLGIIEAEANRKEKELVVISPDAETLRKEFQSRLLHLQESCKHESAEWTDIGSAPGRPRERHLVCPKCEKILKREE